MQRSGLAEHYQKLIEEDKKKVIKPAPSRYYHIKPREKVEAITGEYLSLFDLLQYFDYKTPNSIYVLTCIPETRNFFKFAKLKREGQIRPYRGFVTSKDTLNELFEVMPERLKNKLKKEYRTCS